MPAETYEMGRVWADSRDEAVERISREYPGCWLSALYPVTFVEECWWEYIVALDVKTEMGVELPPSQMPGR